MYVSFGLLLVEAESRFCPIIFLPMHVLLQLEGSSSSLLQLWYEALRGAPTVSQVLSGRCWRRRSLPSESIMSAGLLWFFVSLEYQL